MCVAWIWVFNGWIPKQIRKEISRLVWSDWFNVKRGMKNTSTRGPWFSSNKINSGVLRHESKTRWKSKKSPPPPKKERKKCTSDKSSVRKMTSYFPQSKESVELAEETNPPVRSLRQKLSRDADYHRHANIRYRLHWKGGWYILVRGKRGSMVGFGG